MNLEEVLSEVLDQRLGDVHTALPGRVERYYPGTQTADCKPLVKLHGMALPVLPNVPIAFQRGGTGFLTFPIVPGDSVLLLFCESSIDRWRASGADNNPGDERRHSLTAAVAIPCLYPTSRAFAAHGTNVVLGLESGKQVHVKAGAVALGSENPTKSAAVAEQVLIELQAVKSELDALKLLLSAHIHAGVTTGPGVSGTTAGFVGWATHTPGSVASDVVKIDP